MLLDGIIDQAKIHRAADDTKYLLLLHELARSTLAQNPGLWVRMLDWSSRGQGLPSMEMAAPLMRALIQSRVF